MNLRLRVVETDYLEGDSAFETEIFSDGELDGAASDVEMAVVVFATLRRRSPCRLMALVKGSWNIEKYVHVLIFFQTLF